ncbi:hypothetical protein [Nesterenkonia halotolerans]|uniref:Tetratricopeptide repeat protein n=1 Tax=Nesterenkonia halotolerans TaxID=225325 RepID=A0ABR9J4Z2_9MICC|nr:hypothetical protein [Nesterenkonia halotolerans]MBE1514053.1 hypothetical protein [Nesterenkonia halotolerans]
MKAKFWTGLVIALLAIMLVGAAASAWRFLRVDDLAAQLIGAGAMLIVVLGVWVLGRELLFGIGTERLGRRLEDEGGLPEDTVERSAGGRANREQADEQFKVYAAEAEAAPEDWRSWFRLSIAYDTAGDRVRARKTMRKAISMEKSSRAAR